MDRRIRDSEILDGVTIARHGIGVLEPAGLGPYSHVNPCRGDGYPFAGPPLAKLEHIALERGGLGDGGGLFASVFSLLQQRLRGTIADGK